ncbi:hypothetical protein ACFWFR_00945 [Oerskovia sp. NPDC060287]|uniref:hypothetical protein n=1 Tax=Oerskovia sp. NPDC060287 TaxID=3347095 RepID=UPI0036471F05
MSAPDYVAQVAELLGQHELAQRYTVLDDVCRCSTTVKDHCTHLAEVLAAAGLIPTRTEWGSRMTWDGPKDPTRVPRSRAVTDWKDA